MGYPFRLSDHLVSIVMRNLSNFSRRIPCTARSKTSSLATQYAVRGTYFTIVCAAYRVGSANKRTTSVTSSSSLQISSHAARLCECDPHPRMATLPTVSVKFRVPHAASSASSVCHPSSCSRSPRHPSSRSLQGLFRSDSPRPMPFIWSLTPSRRQWNAKIGLNLSMRCCKALSRRSG